MLSIVSKDPRPIRENMMIEAIELGFTYPAATVLMVTAEFLLVFLCLIVFLPFSDKILDWIPHVLSVMLVIGALQVVYVVSKSDITAHIGITITLLSIYSFFIAVLQFAAQDDFLCQADDELFDGD